MPHQFAAINCKECKMNYCPVCKKLCPNCGKDGIESNEYKKHIENWRRIDKERKEAFEKTKRKIKNG